MTRSPYCETLDSEVATRLLKHDLTGDWQNVFSCWQKQVHAAISKQLEQTEQDNAVQAVIDISDAALCLFLQATVTGPAIEDYDTSHLICARTDQGVRQCFVDSAKRNLTVDGEAIYHLTPYIELFAIAQVIVDPALPAQSCVQRQRIRVNSWHQRLLSSPAPTLQDAIYTDLTALGASIEPGFLIERAAIHLLHDYEVRARKDLSSAAELRDFQYKLVGRLGKRTKFQQKDISQLVVLARSVDHTQGDSSVERNVIKHTPNQTKPTNINLDDDTLLDSIAFSKTDIPSIDLPASLVNLDPAEQPSLHPLDDIILLNTATSITNTSPQHGLTREETLPYAERVISGGSSNWQVYTQALLVRSRIESHKSRTVERGVLQLQALVDQILSSLTPTFLKKASSDESASAEERLQYIHQLGSPLRWQLESELADRWVALGGLRTALEIYERLQMWAEVALCLAANGEEAKATDVVHRQLYLGKEEKSPLPSDAPRLFCILGDLENSAAAYRRAWQISQNRYSRAQRSLAKYFVSKQELDQAEKAYALSLKVRPQDHPTWFALGCVRLQLENWLGASQAFGRAVQIDDEDAESWSNLAIALLRCNQSRESLLALKKAASIKRESFRIWQNLLAVAVQIQPIPHTDIILAQTRLIDILGPKQGEQCIDVPVMEVLLSDVTQSSSRGLEKSMADLFLHRIAPLITSSRRLWVIIGKLNIYLDRPSAALEAYEKAWRTRLVQPGWDSATDSVTLWTDVVDATIDLVDAYESLGERTREETGGGLGGGQAVVAKDWKFKARSALRSVISRVSEIYDGEDEHCSRLQHRLQDLKV